MSQKKYCGRKDFQLKNKTAEEQAETVLLRREEHRLRKRKSRAKARTPFVSGQS